MQGTFRLDGDGGEMDARLAFGLDRQPYHGPHAKGGLPVTDLKWRALGRAWLGSAGNSVEFTTADVRQRLGCHDTYLVIGLTRAFQGSHWPIVVGVHTMPDYEAAVDYKNL